MISKYYTVCFIFVLCLVCNGNIIGQNIRGDTIYVEANKVVTINFPSVPTKATLSSSESQEGVYRVSPMGDNSISILALKEGGKNQDLEVTEGGRTHLFILSYRAGSPARSIDYSTKKKLSKRASEIKNIVSEALTSTNSLFNRALKDTSNLGLWKKVEEGYAGLLKVVEAKDVQSVKSRIEESRRVQESINKENSYRAAMSEGQSYFVSNSFEKARKAYLKAIENKPGDLLALKYLRLTDSVWSKVYIDKGDEANRRKKYIDAKTNYQEAMNLKPDYPSLQDKFNKAKLTADPLIYEIEKKKGDAAMENYDTEEARRAYDSALSVRRNDVDVTRKKKSLEEMEQEIKQEEDKEAEYQGILAKAKSMEDKASNAQEYELAIKEYERALKMFNTRKFPTKKIKDLTRMKNIVKIN
jgi:tetratricopeptide (TPR) repeat protein